MKLEGSLRTVRLRAGNLAVLLEYLMRASECLDRNEITKYLEESEKAVLLVQSWDKTYTTNMYNALKDLDNIPLE